jgi:putative ABC transport system permease protein
MTALAHTATLHGGVAARRALIRWSTRLLRREWRQQILVLTLLTVAVAAAIGSITIVHNTGYAENAEFGSANALLRFDGSDPGKLAASLASARRSFGTTEVIGHRSIPAPGGVENVDFRAQAPHGPYGGSLLAVHSGHYPVGPGQVAVTDGVAELLGLKLGSTLALDGRRRTVVGIVENPRRLSDEFALVSPSSAGPPTQVTILVKASRASMDAFQSQIERGKSAYAGWEERGNDRPAETLTTFSVVTAFLLLASLVAAAGFAVVAQRRLRQLGMLAAIGATQKHLRLVLLTNGALVGTIAAVGGTIVGVVLWVLASPTLESAMDHRVNGLNLPWALIAMTGLLAILGSSAAAWWPARTMARVPVLLALSGRPPKPRPARHAAIAAAVLIAVGIGCLALSSRDTAPLIVAGIVATVLGCLLVGPLAIRVFSGLAGHVSIAPRLALRDLVRYQARSGAALAAVTLALGIAAVVVIVASAEHAKKAAEPPNLSDRQVRIYTGPPELREEPAILTRAQRERRAAGVGRLAGELGGATVIALPKAFEPGVRAMSVGNSRVRPTITAAKQVAGPVGEKNFHAEEQVYVATPAVLRYLGIDPATINPVTDFLVDRSVATKGLVIPSVASRQELAVTNVQRIDTSGHLFGSAFGSTKPPIFVTLGAVRRHGWAQISGGWLIESKRPLTSDQITNARKRAADSGLSIEVEQENDAPTRAMAITTAAGALLALAILAMAVGLIRSESAGDLRTLTATGATSRVRRTLTATTAGALALLGALLGVAGAYILLLALYYDDVGYLRDVPILYLGVAVFGVPLAATAAGWLLSGREPPAIARTVIE